MKKVDRLIWVIIFMANAYFAITTIRTAIVNHSLWAIVLIFSISAIYSAGRIINI